MSKLPQQSIPVALSASSTLDLSCDHVTTMNFGIMQPVYYRHTIKGEKIILGSNATVRPFPLAIPTFGRMRINIRQFFVPWRTVFPQFDYFYNDNIAVNIDDSSVIDQSPQVNNNEFVSLFLTSVYSSEITNYNHNDPFDFQAGLRYYSFTERGKFLFKIFTSLGYAIVWDDKDQTPYSALPILAFAKVYVDYYANQSYMDTADVVFWRKKFAFNDPTSFLSLNSVDLMAFETLVFRACYEPDYFVSAWDSPFAPNHMQYSAINFQDVVSGTSVSNTFDGTGTPVMVQSSNANVSIGTQYLHDALKAITDYSKRHQLAGASNISRTLAQFGFGVSYMKSERSIYLHGSSVDINTGAVYSTANTAAAGDPSNLADYAGNGYGNGSSNCEYTTEELGLFIEIATLLPSGGYYQGMDENNMHIKKDQFFNPEYDGLGVQVIRKRELYVSRNSNYASGSSYDEAFGFTGRYGEMKRPRSWVSGDLACPTWFNGADAWHLMRKFNDASFSNNIANQTHSPGFTHYENDSYDRIFTVDSGNDKFIVEFHHDVKSFAPCHGLFETYEFGTDGKKVQVAANGAICN